MDLYIYGCLLDGSSHMTVTRYFLGFLFSLVLTIVAYILTVSNKGETWLLFTLGLLAILQMIVQLIFFLHLQEEKRPRYQLWSFVFMAGTLLIIVVGSLWIMQNMNYNMLHMSSDEKNGYMLTEHDKGF